MDTHTVSQESASIKVHAFPCGGNTHYAVLEDGKLIAYCHTERSKNAILADAKESS
jgi:hypothetical protein